MVAKHAQKMQQNALNVKPTYGRSKLEVLVSVMEIFNLFNMPIK